MRKRVFNAGNFRLSKRSRREKAVEEDMNSGEDEFLVASIRPGSLN